MRISKEYKKTLEEHHQSNPKWGTTAGRFIHSVETLTKNHFCFDGLDYGCGKGALVKGYKGQTRFTEYDPGIQGKDQLPQNQFDIVTCIDVLEHIEPSCVNDVLDEVIGKGKKVVFLVISTRPAIEKLKDGRNAHLIIEDAEWWLKKIRRRTDGAVMESFNNQELIVTIYKQKE